MDEKAVFSAMLYGGDYNPDQWLRYPEILNEDIQLMKEAKINCVTLGVFSWVTLEPKEGEYHTSWLREIIEALYQNGIYTILATPTAGMPHWLTTQYEEVMQVNEWGIQNLPGKRHNFCPNSPIMRRKMKQINEQLAKTFGEHPAVIAWHISNEYGGNITGDGACHCKYCQDKFREWLKNKYTTLEELNERWWTHFWGHCYTEWSQIQGVSRRGEDTISGLNIDWKRFTNDQLMEFCKEEIKVIRKWSKLPVTTNMMSFYKPMNYFEWAKLVDIVSWDCYGDWHGAQDEIELGVWGAAVQSMMRSLKGAPFLMMESTPSLVNYRKTNALKRPGVNELSSLQAIAHGSNSVQYFQWRKGRGGCEKYHGAVIDHKNGKNTRVFKEVKQLGERLEKMSAQIVETNNKAKVAMLFDWENWWALEETTAIRNDLNYREAFLSYFKPLWEMGIEVDIIDMTKSLDEYELVIAPLNYMYRGNYVREVENYVKSGGSYLTTYWSGEVDENNLCFI